MTTTQPNDDTPTAGPSAGDGRPEGGDRPDERVEVPAIDDVGALSADAAERLRALLAAPRPDVRASVRALLAEPGMEPAAGLPLDEHRQRVLAQLGRVAEQGFPRHGFPRDLGGSGDVPSFLAAFEELTYGDVSLQVKVGVQFGLFGGAIAQLGSARHHQRFLPPTLDAELLGCFAMTETDHGSDVQRLQTTASYDPRSEEFVLVTPDPGAWKDYIGSAALHARWAVVFAQLVTRGEGHGVHALVVRIRHDDGTVADGVRVGDDGHKLGLNGVDNGRLAFDDVRVPREALLDRFASVAPDGTYDSPIDSPDRRFFTMLGALVQGRVAVGGAGVAASRLALTIAVKHAERRRQFAADDAEEVQLMDYLAHQRRLLPLVARTYALGFAQVDLVEELAGVLGSDAGHDGDAAGARRRLETHAAGQKAVATWHARDTIQESREACGGFGYLSENRLAQLMSDMEVYATFEGDNTVLLQLVAKGLLTRYRDEFGDMAPLETARFVAGELAHGVADWTNARQAVQAVVDNLPGRSSRDGLLDPRWQLGMLRAREDHLVGSVARRLRSLLADDMGPAEALNFVQDHVLAAGRAHVERRVLESFHAVVEGEEDDEVRRLLAQVRDLHALSELERDRAWFLEHDLLSVQRSKAVVGTVNALCRRLRPYAEQLVDCFGITDELLRAPIAVRERGEHYLEARQRLGLA